MNEIRKVLSGLRFFRRFERRSLQVASYHHPDSITWRWVLIVGFCTAQPGYRFGLYRCCGWILNFWPFAISLAVQSHMWKQRVSRRCCDSGGCFTCHSEDCRYKCKRTRNDAPGSDDMATTKTGGAAQR